MSQRIYNPFPLTGNFQPLNQYSPFPLVNSAQSGSGVASWGSPLLADDSYGSMSYFGAPETVPPTSPASWTSGYDIPNAMGNTAGYGMPALPGTFDFLKDKNFWIGTREQPGAIGLGLQAAAGIAGTFMGMKQYGLAKQRLQDQKDQFNMNYAAQRTTTNAQLEDRQRARVAANPNAYESVGVYMDRNRIR